MGTHPTEDHLKHLVDKHQLSANEAEYFSKMVGNDSTPALWEAYARSVKSMGMEFLQWLEPSDFAASTRLEEERKAGQAPDQASQKYDLTPEEHHYFQQMLAGEAEHPFVEAYAESVKSMGLDQLDGIDPVDFAASIQLEEERKLESITHSAPPKNIPSPAKPSTKKTHNRDDTWVLKDAQSFLKKNQKLFEEKQKRPKKESLVSVKFLRERQGGVNRTQLKKELNQYLMASIKYDVLLEMMNEEIDYAAEKLKSKYSRSAATITSLLVETEKNSEDTKEANHLKQDIRTQIPKKDDQLHFFKQFRNLTRQIARRKQTRVKSNKYIVMRDERASQLGMLEKIEAAFARKRPAVRAAFRNKNKPLPSD